MHHNDIWDIFVNEKMRRTSLIPRGSNYTLDPDATHQYSFRAKDLEEVKSIYYEILDEK